MYEFHGWITIQETPSEADTGNLERIVAELRAAIAALEWNSGLLQLHAANGVYFLNLGGAANRKGREAADISELLSRIGDAAPGSYGLVYWRDDEDEDGDPNRFHILKMARGQLSEEQDAFLSPCLPVIEDEGD